jgi:predicted lipid carrier protein YhbT
VASQSQVDQAVASVAARLRRVDPQVRSRHVVQRTVACHVPDLGLTWSGLLCEDGLVGVVAQETAALDGGERAQVRLHVDSDDLVALADGQVPLAVAWAAGRLRVEASVRDLLKLRALL